MIIYCPETPIVFLFYFFIIQQAAWLLASAGMAVSLHGSEFEIYFGQISNWIE